MKQSTIFIGLLAALLVLAACSPQTGAADLETQITNARPYLDSGLAYFNQNDFKNALPEFTKAVKLAPDYTAAYGCRALVYFNMENYKKARADFEKALQLDPNNQEARNWLAATVQKEQEISNRKKLNLFGKSRPVMGYDNIPWGASVEKVKEAYNLGPDFVLNQAEDDPNIATLVVSYTEGNITQKQFMFNKWKDNKYKLYRVWVYYAEEKDGQNIVTSLNTMLQEAFGGVTNTWTEDGGGMQYSYGAISSASSSVTTHVIYGTYAPNLEVELINERRTGSGGLGIFVSTHTADRNSVCYTWKKFRDSYQAVKIGL
jgi:tetratricopeptide (TPR) repeat protein